MRPVTVAIPVLNGGQTLAAVLGAVRAQRVEREVELVVCDSGSIDGSRELAERAGARVFDIPSGQFAHGPARNLLMREAHGEFVAMLTQDAQPVDEHWLARLLEGFEVAADVALVYGPYLPRAHAAPRAAADLQRFFSLMSPQGTPRVDRLEPAERELPGHALFGRRTYFTDANGCLRRDAWERIPFPEVAYAEDQALALAMLRAGYAKVYLPSAGVLHSHHYTALERFRRAFDDYRGVLEVYGWRSPAGLGHWVMQLRGRLGTEARALRAADAPPLRWPLALSGAALDHAAELTGAILGSRADRLPEWARRAASLERRASFVPLDGAAPPPGESALTTGAGDAAGQTPSAGGRR
jgi:rhamnosyltransferase